MTQKTMYAITFSMMLTTFAFGQKSGADADSHGCRASAGYTYSIIKNTCIRLWEEKIRLNSSNPDGASFFTAVIFSKDKKKAEVFIPKSKSGVILNRTGKAGKYILKKEKLELTVSNGYFLKRSGKLIYSAAGLVKP